MKKNFFTCIYLIIIAQFFLFCGTSKYLSDKDNVYKKIEEFQKDNNSENLILKKLNKKYFTKRNAYNLLISSMDSIGMFSNEKDSLNKEVYEQMFKKYIPKGYPTRYQDPFEYLIFARLIEDISKQGKILFPKLNYVPKYGTFYANSIAAEAKSYEKEHLLLIHSRYVTFCHQMGKVALQPFHVENSYNNRITISMDTLKINNSIEKDKEINLNFLYTFLEFNYLNFPPNDALFLNDSYFMKALQYWNNSSETFLIGHEYSHALLKHRKSDEDFFSDLTILNSWYNEIEADSVSQVLLNKIVTDKLNDKYQIGWNKFLLAGGLFYLSTLNIFENGQKILYDNNDSIPLSEKDFKIILEILKNKSNTEENLLKLKTINPYFVKFDHPPTEIRIELIKQLYNDQINRIKHVSEKYNLLEDFHRELAEKMIFAMNKMNSTSNKGFHNSYLAKDLLNEKFGK